MIEEGDIREEIKRRNGCLRETPLIQRGLPGNEHRVTTSCRRRDQGAQLDVRPILCFPHLRNTRMRIFEAPFLNETNIAKDYRSPLSLKYDPAMLPESTKQRDDMAKASDVLLTLQGEKSGNVEIDHFIERYSRLGELASSRPTGTSDHMAKSRMRACVECSHMKRKIY